MRKSRIRSRRALHLRQRTAEFASASMAQPRRISDEVAAANGARRDMKAKYR
jgi:hypothetical protein